MKLATWNVNSLGVRLPHLLDWLHANPVDAIGLQELKLTDDKFPHAALASAGYLAAAFGQKTYNGVAIVSREPLVDVVKNIPGFDDEQSRVIAGTLPCGTRLINAYFVNGQAPGTDKFAYKLRWLGALLAFVEAQMVRHPKLVLMGDFNVTADDRDSHDPLGLKDTIHHTQEERAHFQSLLALGMHDAFRLFEPAAKHYSWWDYRMLAYRKNQGLRIDYHLVSDALKPSVLACTIDKAPRKLERPSDHTPVVLTLA